jgi:hypothetical protein
MFEPTSSRVPGDAPSGSSAPAGTPEATSGEARPPSAAAIADGALRQLDPRYVDASRVAWWIFVAVMGLAISGAWVWAWAGGRVGEGMLLPLLGAGLLVIALLTWLASREPRWVFRNTAYKVSELGIQVRKGIFWKQVIDVPRSRVQHTDVMQGPVGRRFGIAKLTIHTAGTQHASVELDGLAREVALEIRDYLIREDRASDD